jgi:hypothetical protein
MFGVHPIPDDLHMNTTEDNAYSAPVFQPGRRSRSGFIAAGILAICGGVAAIPIALFGMFVTANSCGMFADGCDTYGQPAAGFEWFGALFFLGPAAVVTGVVLCVQGRSRPR